MKNDLAMLLRSVPYLRPGQIPERARRLAAETAMLSLKGIRLSGGGGRLATPTGLGPSPRAGQWKSRPAEARRVAADAAGGEFDFVGIKRQYGWPVRWNDPTVPRLWRFRLNGFEVAWAMAHDASRWAPSLARLIRSWHDANPPRRGDPWHPFVVAERLINLLGTRGTWLRYLSGSGPEATGLRQQARFLRGALERDVGGNHLIREATALAVAGHAFGDRALLREGLSLLIREGRRQVLPDGGHYERSPSYHLEVLTDLLEARSLLPAGHAVHDEIDRLTARMADVAVSLCHPDGQVALFNDTGYWPVPPAEYLRRVGLSPTRRWAFPDTGYFVLGEGDSLLFLDAGPPSPRDLPPHAHSDLLSVEVSVGGRRMIVNSGTGDYARGPWRDYWRSTRAHSTIEVDGAEQSETWHSFRMARRANPQDVVILDRGGVHGVSAAHDGYRRLESPVIHRRSVIAADGSWAIADSLEGAGRHDVRSFLHLHPDIDAEVGGVFARLSSGSARLRVTALGPLKPSLRPASLDPLENWYATSLGERIPARSLVLEGRVNLPITIGWYLEPGISDS
jgi:uncharacterized heparinase superfamily protein